MNKLRKRFSNIELITDKDKLILFAFKDYKVQFSNGRASAQIAIMITDPKIDNDWKCEDYAEFQQMNWSKSAIIPYLMDTYSAEYNALSNWIEKYGGVRFSLEKLAGESKGRRIGDRVKLVFSASSAVEYLFKNIINGMKERDAMLEFAKDLLCGDYYEECQKSLDTILQNNPKDSGVLERIEVIGPARAILKAVFNYVVVKNDINIQKYELSKYEHKYLKNTDIMDLLKI